MTCLWLASLALAAVAAPTPPPSRLDVDTLLAKPVSPGIVALLLPHVRDERASARVIESLAHPDAAVRAAAARVANIADLRAGGPAIRRALDAETDRAAALEQLRAAVLLGSSKDDAGLIPLAAKHALVTGFGETLATARGPAALPLLDALQAAGLSEAAAPSMIAVATRRGREGLSVVATSALRTRNAPAWANVLSLAREPGAVLSPGLPVAALGSKTPALRAATYWHLALTHDKAAAPSPEVEAALAGTPEATAADVGDVDAAFAFAVLRRARTGAKGEDWGARAASGVPLIPFTADGEPEPIEDLLTKAEARALSHKLTEGRNEDIFESGKPRPKPRRDEPEAEGYDALSYAGGLPPGMLRDILAIGGCKPGPHLRVIGLVHYGRDGRPRRVSVGTASAPTACPDVAGPILGLTLLPHILIEDRDGEVTSSDGRRVALVVPLDEGSIACAEEPEWSGPARVRERAPAGKIREPRKTNHVNPVYPKRAQEERRQGVVVIEAIISSSGCMRSLRVLAGREPDLNAAAMTAVAQWRYTPTLVDGKPVPVIMTVTVNFRLS